MHEHNHLTQTRPHYGYMVSVDYVHNDTESDWAVPMVKIHNSYDACFAFSRKANFHWSPQMIFFSISHNRRSGWRFMGLFSNHKWVSLPPTDENTASYGKCTAISHADLCE